MADQDYAQVEDGAVTFNAGDYVFTRAEARQCYRLLNEGNTVWQIKEQRHPNATLQQIIVAIQVAIMGQSFTIQELRTVSPHVFNVEIVYLGMWNVGAPIEE